MSGPSLTSALQKDFSAAAGSGTIDGVPAGTGLTLTAQGLNADGIIMYQGTATNITVLAGKTTDAGTIIMNTFTVAVFNSPGIVAKTPADNSAGNPTLSGVSVTFSKVMNRSTLTTATMSVTNGGTALAGEIIADSDNRTFTFIPTAPLPASSTLTATVSTGAQDLSGNALPGALTWSFKTGAASLQWPASILPGTALSLSSPILTALAATHGQTLRPVLDALSSDDLDKAVQAAFAVGVDLANLTPAAAAADPVIQTALRLGTPIVFENSSALTNMSSALAAMSGAIGIGLPGKITVAVPQGALSPQGSTDIYCFDADQIMAAATMTASTQSSGSTPSTDPDKTLGTSIVGTPSAQAITLMIKSAIAQSMQTRSTVKSAAPSAALAAKTASAKAVSKSVASATTTGMPPEISKREYVLRYPEYVWYPGGRSQAFVIQTAVHVQIFSGQGGTRKYVRFLYDDADGSTGFLNSGPILFDSTTDTGYFMSHTMMNIEDYSTPKFVSFGGRSPDYVDAYSVGECFSSFNECNPTPAVSETSFDVDYVSGGVAKTWRSTERRQFDMAEYEMQTFGPGDFRWRLITTYSDRKDKGFSRRLDYTGKWTNNNRNDGPIWERMFNESSTVYSDQVVALHDVAWGRNGASLHPRVQAFYSVAANETRTAHFIASWEQFAWNTWSDGTWPNYSDHKNQYNVRVNRDIYIDFSRNTASSPLWATVTDGHPGARLTMQSDGNYVINSKDGTVLWASNTAGNPGATLTMQNDGNLVIYGTDGRSRWQSGTSGNPGAYDVMQSDGNYVIYTPK